jgi:hypothetical protein
MIKNKKAINSMHNIYLSKKQCLQAFEKRVLLKESKIRAYAMVGDFF